jgi:undecaprenyl diphosphate synthase
MHISIIPDGNRRWAKSKTLLPWDGHRKAVENFRTITDFCRHDERVDILTVWCFSTENWKRDKKEVDMLMGLLEEYLQKERSVFAENRTRLLHSGRKDRIPSSLAKLIEDVEQETKDFDAFTLHLAIDYGGKDEILRTVERLCHARSGDSKIAAPRLTNRGSNSAIDEKTFRSFIDHPDIPDIDLIIRTSNEKRTSNFFLWQSTYAEWFFLDIFFPDFTTKDLSSVLDEYESRTRRFGS